MPQREFANQKALVAYAEQNVLAYEYEYTPAFAKWQRLLSPEQYEIVEARTDRKTCMAFSFDSYSLNSAISFRIYQQNVVIFRTIVAVVQDPAFESR